FINGIRRDQIDRTTAETASGHTRAEDAVAARGDVYKQVKLAAAHLVISAQALVRRIHQFAELSQIAAYQRLDRGDRPRVFSDDVIAPAANGVGQGIGVKIEIVYPYVAQRLNIRHEFG